MSGPPPKDPKLRQRRNKVSTASTLVRGAGRRARVPPLPVRFCTPEFCRCGGSDKCKRRCRPRADGALIVPCEHVCVEREDGQRVVPWHELTKKFWRDAFRSEMAPEYVDVDVHGLFVLAELVDRFWFNPTTTLAAEIRLQRQCFGMTPLDRRRLQWELEGDHAEQPPMRHPVAPSTAGQPEAPRPDPRGVLSMVKRAQ